MPDGKERSSDFGLTVFVMCKGFAILDGLLIVFVLTLRKLSAAFTLVKRSIAA